MCWAGFYLVALDKVLNPVSAALAQPPCASGGDEEENHMHSPSLRTRHLWIGGTMALPFANGETEAHSDKLKATQPIYGKSRT